MKKNILLFWHYNDWGQYGRTYERLAFHLSQISEVSKVVCIFPPIIKSQNDYAFPIYFSKISPSLYIVEQSSHVLPRNGRFWKLRQWSNQNIPDLTLSFFLKLLGFKRNNTLLWLFPPHPYLEKLIQTIPHIISITHVVDDFSKLGKDFWLYDYAVSQYPRLGQLSNIIIVGSKQNYEKFSQQSNNCFLFENAVDSFFINNEPTKIKKNKPPTIGYVGWITERTDLMLIEYLAKKRPDWIIIVAGPQHTEIPKKLLSFENLFFPGPVPYKNVPKLIRSFDVCVIPNKDNDYSRSMSPLKLYQYLASGLPIVSTNVAGISAYKAYIEIANNYEEFVSAIDYVINNDTINNSLERISIAKKQTWDIRTHEIFSTVLNRLDSEK